MSRNGSGVYSLPAGSTVSDGTTATAAQHNTPLSDLETDMNTARPIVAGGTGATTAAAALAALGGIADVVDDTTPTLGGPLDAGGFDINNGGVVFLTEQAAAEADVAGKGQIWVETATPNLLKFTDDAGTDFSVQTQVTASVAEYRDNTAAKLIDTDAAWGAMAEVTLTDAANISWDMDTGIDYTVTLGGNRTLDNATNTQVGKKGRIRVVQDGTGSRTLAFGTSYEFAGGTAPTLTTTAAAEDVLYYDCISSTRILISSILDIS